MEKQTAIRRLRNRFREARTILKLSALALLLVFASCKEDDKPAWEEIPIITKNIAPSDEITLQIGDSFELSAELRRYNDISFSWTVNEVEVSTALSYTFTPEETGSFRVVFKAEHANGNYAWDVCYFYVKRYAGGYFILNEGSLGSNGSINYYYPETQTLVKNIFQANNPDLSLGMTSQYGIIGEYMYIISKGDPFGRIAPSEITIIDPSSMKHVSTIRLDPDVHGYAHSFFASGGSGIVTTTKGTFTFNPVSMSIGGLLEGSNTGDEDYEKENGAVTQAGNHFFVINRSQGILAYTTGNYSLVKKLGMASVGFAKSWDRSSLWAADDNKLIKINVEDLTTEEIELPTGVTLNNSWGAWNAGSLCASPNGNAVYFVQTGEWNMGGNKIYRYVDGDLSSLDAPFAQGGPQDAFYGAALSVDPGTGDLIVNYVDEGWGESFSKNRIVTYDSETGLEKSRFVYPDDEYWFPAMTIY